MTEPTHEEIISRVDRLEERVEAVEDGVRQNRAHFDIALGKLSSSLTDHRREFAVHTAEITSMFRGASLALKVVAGALTLIVAAIGLVVAL